MPERKIGNVESGIKTGDGGKPLSLGKQWFFGVGISEYDEFPNLYNAVKDVTDVGELLVEDYGFLPEHAVTLFNDQATKENIINKLDEFVERVDEEDSLLVYFAGHGHMSAETKRGSWIPGNAKRSSTSRYLRNSTIRDYLADIKSKHTLLIADSSTCCFWMVFTLRTSMGLHGFVGLKPRTLMSYPS